VGPARAAAQARIREPVQAQKEPLCVTIRLAFPFRTA